MAARCNAVWPSVSSAFTCKHKTQPSHSDPPAVTVCLQERGFTLAPCFCRTSMMSL